MNPPADKELSELIRKKAGELGFDLCGIAPSRIMIEHEPVLKSWCSAGMNGGMDYLGRNTARRINPEMLFPGAKSVIVTGLNYFTRAKQGGGGIPVISRYAYGINYHDVIISKLNKLIEFIKQYRPDAGARSFVDSAPLLEKAWAREAGLGWPGRHSVVINKRIGSFFFIGIILTGLSLEYDRPVTEDNCRGCRLCIESCPTGAINENRTIDVRKCIAYLTIESKEPVPEKFVPVMEGRVFGCDKCQEVCPWNRSALPGTVPEFEMKPGVRQMTTDDWLNLSEEKFRALFKSSAIGRKDYRIFAENISLVTISGT
jgi:epoxyqueuosine reductase